MFLTGEISQTCGYYFFPEARSKACCEKSADAIVDTDTSLPMEKKMYSRKPYEVLKGRTLL